MDATSKYFLPFQAKWIQDKSPLKIIEKSRQIGMSYTTAYSVVREGSLKGQTNDTWVSSRDDLQAKLFVEDCSKWAGILSIAAENLGEMVIDKDKDVSAFVLRFANGRAVYSLSSNPNALAGKRGRVILDEVALHKDQRLLYRIAKPVTTWGGSLELISTHRGANTVFNEIIRSIVEKSNPMGFSHHKVTLANAVDQGLVEKINAKTGRNETRAEYLARIESECLDQEQWLQEYCCIPCDESTAFITYDMITGVETPGCIKDLEYLLNCPNALYLGMDVARKTDLTVIDIGEKIGDVLWDRMRIVIKGKTFAEQREILYRFLAMPQIKRACLDATGLGMQMAEEAKAQFGWKVEPYMFTAASKEALVYPLKARFEDKRLRIDNDPALRADLRGLKKEVTASGNIRFVGESEDSHCDRTWALALRCHAADIKFDLGACVA